MKKQILAICLFAVLLFSLCMPVAAAGTESFTHWDISGNNKKAVYSKDVYITETVISARTLGLTESIVIMDIATDDKGNLYILTEDSRIFVVDSNNRFLREIAVTDANGETIDFSGAKGIYITGDNQLFISDSANGRVLICDNTTGKLIYEIGTPDSPVLPDDFNFIPTKSVKDSNGFVYVISEGAYYGALQFDQSYKFLGFYGANSVNASVLTTLQNLWDILVKNDEKRAGEMKKVPYQFIDIDIDSKDFAYTCTGTAGGGVNGQIRMLSPGGSNILNKNFGASVVSSSSFNFSEKEIAIRRDAAVRQSFVGVQVDEQGYIYGLETVYGFVYVYDTECNLITVFGGGKDSGDRVGTFNAAAALAVANGKVYVADSHLNNVTVFGITPFGKKLLDAQSLTLEGEYIEAKPMWQEIIGEDQNCRIALSALGKAAYSEGDYKLSMEYSELAFDRVTYDQAMAKNQEIYISNNFVWIFIIIVAVIGAALALIIVSRKKKIVFIKNEKVSIMTTCCMHPFKNFNEIKYKNKGSVIVAIVLTLLFFLSNVVNLVYTDFRFTAFNAVTYNPAFEFIKTVGLILIWSIGNWAVSVLLEGKARFKEVFIVTAYATFPLIIGNIINTIASHFINSTSGVIISGVNIVVMILAGIILVIGTMIVQEFSFPKFICTALLTLFAMILIIFIVFMIGMLLSQLWQFVLTAFSEVSFR